MAKKNLITLSLTAIFILAGATSAMATITGISSDGCPGTTCQPSFVSPIVAGKQMTVAVNGQYVDLSTRVEISGSGVSVSYGDRAGGSNSSIVVKFNVDSSAALGERTVKLRYAIETNGPDTFQVKVVRGGRIDQIQQRVPGLMAGTTRLVAAETIPVNQRVTLVFTGTKLGNATIVPIQAVKNPQTLSGCSETHCEVELEFTQSGTHNINLYDAGLDPQTVGALAVEGTLFHFFYGGTKQVTVVGQANPSPTGNVIHPIVGSTGGANPGFIDIAAGANIGNLFRGTGNSITVEGVKFLQVEDHWCQDNNVQTPVDRSPSNSKVITIPDLIWRVSNVGTAEITVGFDSQLLSNGAVRQTQNIAAGTLHPGATRDFAFPRTTGTTVRLFRFAPPNQPGCFIKPSAGPTEFFVDPPFTVQVDVGHAAGETATNRSNNTRNY